MQNDLPLFISWWRDTSRGRKIKGGCWFIYICRCFAIEGWCKDQANSQANKNCCKTRTTTATASKKPIAAPKTQNTTENRGTKRVQQKISVDNDEPELKKSRGQKAKLPSTVTVKSRTVQAKKKEGAMQSKNRKEETVAIQSLLGVLTGKPEC